jgi:gluconate 2-dehydrogenase subunit 3-like protein
MGEIEPRFPGYDVLAKRDTPSWNAQTRRVVDRRLAMANEPAFFTPTEWRTLQAICARILPQPSGRRAVPTAVLIDHKMATDQRDGFRHASMPPQREAWRRGLAALNEEACASYGAPFHALTDGDGDELLRKIAKGEVRTPAWGDMPADRFFADRLLHDIGSSYYAHPTAWNEIGFGGPASPRGYVRMDFDRRDPWEAVARDD